MGGLLLVIAGITGYLAWMRWAPGRDLYEIYQPITASPGDCSADRRFAIVGDYGHDGRAEAQVATLVDSWQVDFITTVGDNNYPWGLAKSIDRNIGQYYHSYIYPYAGIYGGGADENRFFPALGNHDWRSGTIQAYLDYFTLPGNERYYDIRRGPVHLFIVDSDTREPDGRTADSAQAKWLQRRLQGNTTPWKIVLLHHAPYSSSTMHGSDIELQWPFAEWGATAVIAGHDHTYERLQAEGIPYFVNGLGGRSIYRMGAALPESAVRYNQAYGAMLATAGSHCINLSFFNTEGDLIDSLTLGQAS